jgi:hypothetical protein
MKSWSFFLLVSLVAVTCGAPKRTTEPAAKDSVAVERAAVDTVIDPSMLPDPDFQQDMESLRHMKRDSLGWPIKLQPEEWKAATESDDIPGRGSRPDTKFNQPFLDSLAAAHRRDQAHWDSVYRANQMKAKDSLPDK